MSLKTKYDQLRHDYKELKEKFKRIENLANQRSHPYDMYKDELEFYEQKIQSKLDNYLVYYNNLTHSVTPHSYQEIYHQTLPYLKKNLILYVKKINAFIKYSQFVHNSNLESPIWNQMKSKYSNEIIEYNKTIANKIKTISDLLQSDSWTISLDSITKLIRTSTLEWIQEGLHLLNSINYNL